MKTKAMGLADQKEWVKHYQETYIRVLIDGKWESMWVDRATPDGPHGIYIQGSTAKKRGFDFFSYGPGNASITPTLCEVDTSFPKTGLFNPPKAGTAYMIERNPNRQWKRGLCRMNTFLHLPILKEFKGVLDAATVLWDTSLHDYIGEEEGARLNMHVAEAAFSQNFQSYEQAIQDCKDGVRGMSALDSDTAISVSPYSKGLLFWKGCHPVAEVDYDNSRSVVATVPMFRQEVVDFFARARRHDINVV